MPARSNEFQKLVYLVKKVLAGTDATVTESKFLKDLQTGDEREVDVCIEARVGGHPVVLCIECIDHSRPAAVTWVEQMQSKHQRLPTNALVLASRSGFSKRARSLARVAGIELMTFTRVSEDDVQRALDLTADLWAMRYDLTITKVVGSVPALGDLPEERIAFRSDNLVFDQNRKQLATIADLATALLKRPQIHETIRREGDESHTFFTLEGTPKFLVTADVFVEKMEPRVLRRLQDVRVDGKCRIVKRRIQLQHGRLGEVRIAWGSTVLGPNRATVLAVKTQDAEPTLTMHLTASGDADEQESPSDSVR
ncbi:MAG: hypothetical protein IAG10_03760 [Planctomycetaceae bacterium]|nr:hypothetical protein [Planctomycetaceae bacterium]